MTRSSKGCNARSSNTSSAPGWLPLRSRRTTLACHSPSACNPWKLWTEEYRNCDRCQAYMSPDGIRTSRKPRLCEPREPLDRDRCLIAASPEASGIETQTRQALKNLEKALALADPYSVSRRARPTRWFDLRLVDRIGILWLR